MRTVFRKLLTVLEPAPAYIQARSESSGGDLDCVELAFGLHIHVHVIYKLPIRTCFFTNK